ncbi:MAG: hypothetical protein ACYDFU_09615 [Nitrospirota bacterium]
MKKIFLSLSVIVFLSGFSLTAFAKPHKPVFSSFSTLTLNGIMRIANVSVRSVGSKSKIVLHRIARHSKDVSTGVGDNMQVIFNNTSTTVTGTVSFDTDGVWLGFNGPLLLKQAEHILKTGVNGVGVIRVNGTVGYDPATGLFTGSGEVVKFTGTVNLFGVIKSGGGRAMIKAKMPLLLPATEMSVFSNVSGAPVFGSGTSVIVRMSVPAVQLIKAP